MKYLISFLVLVNFSSLNAGSVTPRIKEVVYEGSGCPRDSVEVVRGEDGSSVRLNFDQFVAEALRIEAVTKNCAIRATVEIPRGYSVAVRDSSFGVEHELSGSSIGRVSVDTVFAGRKASASVNLGRGGYSTIRTGELGWTACGAETDLRFFLKLNVRKVSARDVARAAVVDSQSIDLMWRNCP